MQCMLTFVYRCTFLCWSGKPCPVLGWQQDVTSISLALLQPICNFLAEHNNLRQTAAGSTLTGSFCGIWRTSRPQHVYLRLTSPRKDITRAFTSNDSFSQARNSEASEAMLLKNCMAAEGAIEMSTQADLLEVAEILQWQETTVVVFIVAGFDSVSGSRPN